MNPKLLVKGIEIVGVLFAAFGGFLAGIAPPQSADARFAVGLSSFFALIILFVVAALAGERYRKAWLIAAVCLLVASVGAAYYYKTTYDALTFEYPPGSTVVEHVAGADMSEEARAYKEENKGLSNAQLLAAFGGLQNKTLVWPEESINRARTKLIASYLALVLTIAASIFALSEGVLAYTPSAPPATAAASAGEVTGVGVRRGEAGAGGAQARAPEDAQGSGRANGSSSAPTPDPERQSDKRPQADAGSNFTVFISYAHRDNEDPDPSRRWLDRLLEYLRPLVIQNQVSTWSDTQISLGENWNTSIQSQLKNARVAILLVSPAFLASDYIRSSELPILLMNARERGVAVVPIIVRHSLFSETKFKYPDPKNGPEELSLSVFQAANSPSRPLNAMEEHEQDRVLLSIAQSILRMAQSTR